MNEVVFLNHKRRRIILNNSELTIIFKILYPFIRHIIGPRIFLYGHPVCNDDVQLVLLPYQTQLKN